MWKSGDQIGEHVEMGVRVHMPAAAVGMAKIGRGEDLGPVSDEVLRDAHDALCCSFNYIGCVKLCRRCGASWSYAKPMCRAFSPREFGSMHTWAFGPG